MSRYATGAVFVFVGVALVYAAATGNLQSAWLGLQGKCKAGEAAKAAPSGAQLTQPNTTADPIGGGGAGADYYYVGTDGRTWGGNAGSLPR